MKTENATTLDAANAEEVSPARVPLVGDSTDNPIVNEVFRRFETEGREPIALYRALANCPQILKDYSALATCLRYEATADRELRELVILRVAQMIGSDYEWSHHQPMAAEVGITEDQVRSLGSWESSELFNKAQRMALRIAEGVHFATLSTATFDEARMHLGETEAIELVVVSAFYEAVARIIQGLGIQIEPAYIGFLNDHRLEPPSENGDQSG